MLKEKIESAVYGLNVLSHVVAPDAWHAIKTAGDNLLATAEQVGELEKRLLVPGQEHEITGAQAQ
jgi:hypothetical protein